MGACFPCIWIEVRTLHAEFSRHGCPKKKDDFHDLEGTLGGSETVTPGLARCAYREAHIILVRRRLKEMIAIS